MGAAGADTATSVTLSMGAVIRTGLGEFPIATKSIDCGEGSAEVRAARAARMTGVDMVTVVDIHEKGEKKNDLKQIERV